ncbi:MAG: radical SAM protein [Oscillospiraceae bacterium]|jgi:organic radical activating enzyme|nr:radical SAM protein [Oscillospiraceae bacterium]
MHLFFTKKGIDPHYFWHILLYPLFPKFYYTRQNAKRLLRRLYTVLGWFVALFRYACLRRKGTVLQVAEIVVTEKCTLRCKDCGNLMQYYHKPHNRPMEAVLDDAAALLSHIHSLLTIHILGGEPLCHPQLAEIIDSFVQCEKVRDVRIISNGTIIPSEAVLQAMQHPKVSLRFSLYSAAPQKIETLERLCIERGIRYEVFPVTWCSFGDLEKRNYSPEMLQKSFDTCAHKYKTLLGGYLYGCPRAAHAANLGVLPLGSDAIDVRNPTNFAAECKRLRKKPYAACDYCTAPWLREPVTPGIQAEAPLTYTGKPI